MSYKMHTFPAIMPVKIAHGACKLSHRMLMFVQGFPCNWPSDGREPYHKINLKADVFFTCIIQPYTAFNGFIETSS